MLGVWGWLAAGVAVVLLSIDWVFGLRTLWLIAASRLQKRIGILDEIDFYGLVGIADIDLYLHMNNARYLRECDFARIKLWLLTDTFQLLRQTYNGSKRAYLVLGASTIRYRRSLEPFEPFNLKTRVLCWDDNSFYVEQRFLSRTGFVKAVVLAQQRIVGLSPQQIVDKLHGGMASPPMPTEVAAWVAFIGESRLKLRPPETAP